ncbi:hypothetical protein TNCV_792091 [Trichonephila clavipes]|nr:hypothetical protein TNCV_792091 [Trichonephila clavipes]
MAPSSGGSRYQILTLESTLTQNLHLRLDISELHGIKLPVRLINTTNERRLVQGRETTLRVKGDIKDVSSKLDNEG